MLLLEGAQVTLYVRKIKHLSEWSKDGGSLLSKTKMKAYTIR